jgi:serine/threonine-protein kinase
MMAAHVMTGHLSPEEPTVKRSPEETPTVIVTETAHRPLQLTPGTVLGGRYRMVSIVGRGGMGEVYRADDLKLGQTVALKFLAHRDHTQRVYEEVRIGRQISHPNVCRLYDVAEADGQLFITMEFVDGEDLASLLRRVGRLPPEKALAVSRDICAGVAAAHEKGVIHRDMKPANVMIDGRGRARVTDFGLAVAGEYASDGAGTPAYMAPEQLAGGPATIQTDVYAVGLVLYEVFTGRRAFEAASSTHNLLERQRAGDFSRPSNVTRDVPAAVERVIVRCLDPEPAMRPPSVADVLHELPGDPLSAAVAAGETPSPAMVAAASKTGDLPAPIAWLMLALAVAGFAASAVLGGRTLLYRVEEVKAPEVLQERARQILADAGLPERPADSDQFVAREVDRLVVIYRQSRSPMHPRNGDGRLLRNDPPLERGMANVELDAAGRLVGLTIVPPAVDRNARTEPDWQPFIKAAGYDVRALSPVAPEWAAPVDSDLKSAWLAKDGSRIEAAAYHGRPVWFAAGVEQSIRAVATADRLAFAMSVVFLIGIPVAVLLMARRNLRRRQVDRAGAFRAAGFFFVAMFIALVFRAHHPMSFVDDWIITSWNVVQATFWALIIGLGYIALEPFVRRRWPQILISWTRLLAGRFTDPMVGRDILMGAAAAAIALVLWHTTSVVSGNTTLGPISSMGPARFVVFWLAWTLAEAVLRGVGLVVLLVVLRAVIPSDVFASLLTTLLIATLTLGDAAGPLWLRALYAVTASHLGVMLARHFGLLAVISFAFFCLIQQRLPFTLDADAWYFGRSAVVLLLLTAITAFGFRVSVGGRRWLPRMGE